MSAIATSRKLTSALVIAVAFVVMTSYAAVQVVAQHDANRAIQSIKSAIMEFALGDTGAYSKVTVTIGREGFEKALASADAKTPIIASFISSTDYESVLADHPISVKTTAIYSNPDPVAQVVLARTLREHGRLSVVQSPISLSITRSIDPSTVNVIEHPSSIQQLLRKLNGTDLFVVFPDASTLNSGNVRYVIRSLYRQGAALVGYSEKITSIGGLASVYPARYAMLSELEKTMQQYGQTGQLPDPTFVDDVEVSVNQRLATSLGFSGLHEGELERIVERELGFTQ